MPSLSATLEERVDPMVGIAVAITAISTSAILVRWSSAPSVVKAFYRMVVMAIAVTPFALRDVDVLTAITKRDLGLAIFSGLALAAHFASFFQSLELTTVAASVTLITTQPVFVVVVAASLLDERLTFRMVGGIVFALLGALSMSIGPIVVGPLFGSGDVFAALGSAFADNSEQLLGNAIALAGALFGAIYVLTGRSLRQRLSLFAYTFVVYSVSSLALGVIAVGTGTQLLGYPSSEWILFIALGLVPGMFGHTIINWSLKYVESSVVSVAFLGEPVGSTILALVLLGEVPEIVTIVGGIVVLVGIFVTSRARAT